MLSGKKENTILKRVGDIMTNKIKNRLIVAFTMVFMIMGLTVGPATSSAIAAASIEEVQTSGASYGEWSARWWQWLLSIPAAINPNLDTDGTNCAQGQYDDVWFLAGTFGETVTRDCDIPAGIPIFIPLINNVVFKRFGTETLLDLRSQAAETIDDVTMLSFSIDNESVPVDLFNFRVRSPAFTVMAPTHGLLPPGWLSVPGNTDQLVSDGYWLLISPLEPGAHVIHSHAETEDGFVVDVTYNLTID